MKKISFLGLTIAFAIVLSGCGSSDSIDEPTYGDWTVSPPSWLQGTWYTEYHWTTPFITEHWTVTSSSLYYSGSWTFSIPDEYDTGSESSTSTEYSVTAQGYSYDYASGDGSKSMTFTFTYVSDNQITVQETINGDTSTTDFYKTDPDST